MKVRNMLKKIVSGVLAVTMVLSMPGNVKAAGSTTNMETLKPQITSAQAELDAAKKEQTERLAQYNRGLLGFIEWMETKSDLTAQQKKDLSTGKDVLQKAIKEDFSEWYGGTNTGLPASRNNKVVVLGDEYDAIAIDNLQTGINQMKRVNELRASDDNYVGVMKRNPGRTNFYMMAVATSGADRGAGLRNHSLLQVSCENLSFGGSPASMWYSEKSIFNKYKESLNITTLTSQSDVANIDKAAKADGKTVGHYTNLFWSVDQLMGVGYTNYRGTGCFNASKLSNYSSYATYSIEEFEDIYKEYMAYIDPAVYQNKVDAAQSKLDALLNQYYAACPEHTYGEVTTVAATCTEKGYTSKTCKTCGYELRTYTSDALGHDLTEGVCARCGKTTPIKLNDVWWRLNNHTSGVANQTYEIGDEVKITLDFTSASEDKNKDKFKFDFSDPTIMKYEAGNFNTGTMTMLKQGECRVTITAVDNPSVSKVYNIEVTEKGGHNYVLNVDTDGDGKTTKICSKCKKEVEVTVPASITEVSFSQNGLGTYVPIEYEENTEVEVHVYYTPRSLDNREFVVEVEDSTIASYTPGSNGYTGTLKMLKPGETTIKVYAKYNPKASMTYNLEVVETGGHDWKIMEDEDGDGKTTKICVKCKKEVEVTVPASITEVSFSQNGSGQFTPVEYEENAEVDVYVYYTPRSVDNREFVVEVEDPTIASYTPGSNGYTGTLKMLKPGETTIKVYAKYNPKASMTYTLEVMETGGHDFVPAIDEDGDGTSTATCSKCGKKKEISVPTSVYAFVKNAETGSYTSSWEDTYNVGDKIDTKVRINNMAYNDLVIEISNPEVASYENIGNFEKDGYYYKAQEGAITCKKAGITNLIVYPKYNPSAKKTYTIRVVDSDSAEVSFDLADAEITIQGDCIADGFSCCPAYTVIYKGVVLTSGTDYTVTYMNNRLPGTATLTITGKGLFTGTKEASYTIKQGDLTGAEINLSKTNFADDEQRHPRVVSVYVAGRYISPYVYSVSYTENKDGTVTVTITGGGTYVTGSASTTIKPEHTTHIYGDWYEETAPTCEKTGVRRHDCKYCDACETENVDALGHDYAVVFDWAEDGSSCEAILVCKRDETHTSTISKEDVEGPELIDQHEATCTKKAYKTYKVVATYNGKSYSDEKTIDQGMDIDEDAHPASSIVKENAVAATCENPGLTEGSHCRECGAVIERQKTIAALGHDWGAPVYIWSDDYTACTAQFTCKRDHKHIRTVACDVKVDELVKPTCDKDGFITYSIAQFTFEGKTYESEEARTQVLSATGNHIFTRKVVSDQTRKSEATYESPAVYYYSCANCDAVDRGDKAKTFTSGNALTKPEKPGNGDGGNVLPAVNVYYLTHVQTYGWQGDRDNYKTWKKNGETAGTFGEAKRLESIQIKLDTDADLGVEYRTHIQTYGWEKNYRANGVMSGTSGEAKRLEAISIRLTGADKNKYDIYYRVHAQTYGWLGWAKNGQNAGTAAQAKRLEGIQIVVVPRGQKPSQGAVGYSYIELGKAAVNNDSAGMINYMTHVQSYGDQKYVYDGSVSGTFGEAKRLEGIRIKLNPEKTGYSGSVQYQTQVQTYGWLSWSKDGAFNGTHGKAKRLEAIRIQLTGEVAQHYDVYYRVHSQTYGWLGWAKNGETAGTVGLAKRLEGIQVVLVPKGQGAPNYLPGTQGMRAYITR